MFQYIKIVVRLIEASIDSSPSSDNDKARFKIYSGLTVAALVVLFAFGSYRFFRSDYVTFSLIFASSVIFIVGWYLTLQDVGDRTYYRITIFSITLLYIYVLVVGGDDGTQILWMYTYPFFVFFLFGEKEGLIWNTILTLTIVIIFWNPANWSIVYGYLFHLKIRFLVTFVLLTLITYLFEKFRFNSTFEIQQKNKLLQDEIVERKAAEEEKGKLINELQQALNEVKTLSGILPICASCKKIRDDKGYWSQVEVYIRDNSDAQLSHGICPECNERLYGDLLRRE